MKKQEEKVKIAFIGTSSIGKTALVEELGKRLGDRAFVVEEASRAFFEQNQVADRFSTETQGKIQMLALDNEKKAHNSGAKIILCDRSVLDAVVYTRAHGDREGAEELFSRIEFWLPTYNKFLLLDPTDVPYVTDDIRRESEQERQNFHRAFLDFFYERGIPFELISGTLDERINRVEEIIKLV